MWVVAGSGCSGLKLDELKPVVQPEPEQDGGRQPPVSEDAAMHDATRPPPLVSIDCSGEEFAVCSRPNADSACLGDDCLIVRCLEDFVDCDEDADNGCETKLDLPEHCGRCNTPCALANVVRHACVSTSNGSPRCDIDRSCPEGTENCSAEDPANGCKQGFADCDLAADNGCETPLDTRSDCGACGSECKSAEALAECVSGQCEVVGCAPGSGDCDGEGCRSLAADNDHCGECDNVCSDGTQCAGGRCTDLVCDPDTADCNGQSDDGCEADLSSTQPCGSCDNACPDYSRGSAACQDGLCVIDSCDPDYDDCNGEPEDGCEVSLTGVANCRACGMDCSALPNVASAGCGAEGCEDFVCEEGFGDCNGMAADGCEQPLNTTTHCGACDEACSNDHGTSMCNGGSCEVTACEPGWDDCNMQAGDGCEADLGDVMSCGGCGNDCGSAGECVDGACGCTTSAGCPPGRECCGGRCVNTHSDCFPWPCIPGTVADALHCGGCGSVCPISALFCCLIP